MPQYKRRLLKDYPSEFWKCIPNPGGNAYCCFFCNDFFKTKSQRKSHMKECMLEETGEEYDEEYLFEEDVSLADILRESDVCESIIKDFIRSNEMESMSDKTGNEIQAYIMRKMCENGVRKPDITMIFKIYNFFFDVPEAEYEAYRNKWVQEVMEMM
jgi:hypothetical protein